MLRYGENPHQQAAFYVDPDCRPAVRRWRPSSCTARNCLQQLARPRLGAGPGRASSTARRPWSSSTTTPAARPSPTRLAKAFRNAWAGDPVSAFGRRDRHSTAPSMPRPPRRCRARPLRRSDHRAGLPPGSGAAAHDRADLEEERPAARGGGLAAIVRPARRWRYPPVDGGLLRADPGRRARRARASRRSSPARQPTDAQRRDLQFAWVVCKHVKSNAIVLAKDQQVVGVGAGQMSRVDVGRHRHGEGRRTGAGRVLASRCVLPLPRQRRSAAKAGITAIVQPGGSKRDEEASTPATSTASPCCSPGVRHFRH